MLMMQTLFYSCEQKAMSLPCGSVTMKRGLNGSSQTFFILFTNIISIAKIDIWFILILFHRKLIMGCDVSSDIQPVDSKVTPCKRHLTESKKEKFLEAIESDNLLAMALVMEEQRILPTSQVSDEGMNWMPTHMCCRWNSPHCLEYILKEYFSQNPIGYIDYVNAPTIQGYTCLHLCGIWKADKCFGLLLQYGGLNLRAHDKMRKTPLQTALDFKSKKVSETLKQFKDLNVDFLQINTQKLSSGSLLEDIPKTNEKDEERYAIKLDKNLYGVTGNLFDYTAEENKIKEKQKQLQLEKERIIQQKLKKKEEEARIKKQQKQKEKERKQEELRKKKQEEQKKQTENVMGMLANYVEQYEEADDDSEWWSDQDSDQDDEDRNLTNTLHERQQSIQKQQEELQRIEKQKMDAFKAQQNKKAQEVLLNKQNELGKRMETNQTYLRANQNAVQARAPATVTRSQAKKVVQQEINQGLPAEIQSLYEKAKAKGQFVDEQFPAKPSTIGDSSKKNFQSLTTNLVWLRPSQFFNGQYQLFDGIDPNDIKQGSLGVCYMLASISALAANPKNIEKIFVFHDIQIGFYVLKLFINGQPKHMVVDDLIPCNKHSKSPLFTKPIGNQVWVLLLEKAWAKAIGNYLSAEAMTPDHMMQDLSGAPGYGSWFKTEGSLTREKKVQECVRHDQLGHIVVITSVGDKKIEGIANNHAYSMLKTYEHQGKTLFKIRNPWGRFQWNGQYGENSALWTPQLKNLVSFEKKDDGIFFLSQAEILQAFCYYSVSQIHPEFKYSYTPFTSGDREDIFFKFSLTSETQLNLRVTQLFKRMVKDPDYDHSPLIFEVGKIEGGEVIYLAQGHQRAFWGAKSVHAFPDITKNLAAGNYIVRVRMLWKNSAKYNSAVLGVYANQPVHLQKISPEQGIPLWKLMLIDYCKNSPERTSGKVKYKVVTMRGQFVFPVYATEPCKVTLKFDRAKMSLVDMGQGAISGHEILLSPDANRPDVGTMVRTEPAKGGSTGQFYITAS